MGKSERKQDEKLVNKPVQVKFPDWQLLEIEEAAKFSGKSKVELIRLATEAGLEYLKSINYRVGKAVIEKIERDRDKL